MLGEKIIITRLISEEVAFTTPKQMKKQKADEQNRRTKW